MNDEKDLVNPDTATQSLLRWYPARWRDRYGDEFAAMIEDDLGGGPSSVRYRLSIVRSGLREQLREAGLVGDSLPSSDRMRAGALAILCAFALFAIAGIGFAKTSEHWDQAIHQGARNLPAVSFNLLGSLAAACAAAVIIASLGFLPCFARFVRAGGWPAIKRRVGRAVTATLGTVVAAGALVSWAQRLTNHQRNVGFGWYQLLFLITAALVAFTVATWSAAAVAIARRLDIGLRQLRFAGVLAVVVAVCMPIMTAAAAAWWGSMAGAAPWFLAGTPVGSSPSPLSPNLLIVLVMMMVASGVGVFGLLRVVRSWHHFRE